MAWKNLPNFAGLPRFWWFLPVFIAAGVVLVFQTSGIVSAQAPTGASAISDNQVNAVASQLYCPVCENIPLDVCPTTACAQWRDLIRQMLSEGRSVDYIKNYFVVHYGTRVLAQPPGNGFDLLIYILPPIIFLAGVFIVYRLFRKAHKPAALQSSPAVELPTREKYLDQIEDELRRRR